MQDLKKDYRYIQVASLLPPILKATLLLIPDNETFTIQELRFNIGSPLGVWTSGGYRFVGRDGRLYKFPSVDCPVITSSDISQIFQMLCRYSVHTHQHEINKGFISIAGGHRAGLGGTAVYKDEQIASVKDISSINLRIAREVQGCANELMQKLFSQGLCSVIIAGAPSSGKTTILRDIARQLSEGRTGECTKVCVVDERGEIAAVYLGCKGNSMGPCCDVLSGYSKAEGILQSVRTLSPQVIICDEIGSENELAALEDSFNSGVKMIISIHAATLEELKSKPQGKRLLACREFKKVVFLSTSHTGSVREIIELTEVSYDN